ncbi:unnamed protein product [Urochloa decumbens]|uniref:F-box domain-containing protein n=1 Tax=Urochloa decumbens TaxID=240449 RepID=A0ABC8WDP6_9POAL
MDGGESSGGPLKRRRKEPFASADRLSKLDDVALGHILSFLPAKEAARAAVLSPRWCYVFAAVHTVSLDEPEGTDNDDDNSRGGCDSPSDRRQRRHHRQPPIFPSAVSAAIIARQRRRGVAPLRALRVAMERYRGSDSTMVDQWVFPSPTVDDVGSQSDDEDDDERDRRHEECIAPRLLCDPPEYIVPRLLFSCADLRSLSLSSCRLAPPRTVTLPSLVSLLLSHVPDASTDMERLVCGCPRLADLTLEVCKAVTTLTVLGGGRLRRLALRCCHNLATVTIDSSELRTFEYRGAVPDNASFLTMHGGTRSIAYCKVDLCGAEATSEAELTNLRHLLHLPPPSRDEGMPANSDTGAIDATRRVLEHAPNLEALSLAFHPQKSPLEHAWGMCHEADYIPEEELDALHHLGYNPDSVLATPIAMIPCLRSKVKEINLVHYHGGTAQRALAKFLLCNAPAVDNLWYEFAEGPMWMQVQLMREIKGWLINKSANTHFA